MKITLRLIVSLIIVVAVVAIAFSLYQVKIERQRLTRDLERRTILLSESLEESIIPLVQNKNFIKLNRFVEKFGNKERLIGIIVNDIQGGVIASTKAISGYAPIILPQVLNSISEKKAIYDFKKVDVREVFVYTKSFEDEEGNITGALSLFQDASFIDVRLREIWKYNFIRLLILSVVIVVITLFVIRWSITGPIAQIAEWIRDMRLGNEKGKKKTKALTGDVFAPLVKEVTHLAKTLSMAQKGMEEERIKLDGESLWNAEKLKAYISDKLGDRRLFVISNREPYLHLKEEGRIKYVVPPGGLVTALDPVMRVCNGVWIAHGSGDADRMVVDEKNKIRVPPDNPSYTLKRVWLTKEEEDGYYYGFANEGIWPLCHITHERPIFRLNDWGYYQKVNEKFGLSILEEIEDIESPLILVQDYHFALLPYIIKEKRPDARVAIFWHIPWPNPETYGYK